MGHPSRPLTNSLGSIKHMICCIARLHNFCIDERLRETTGEGARATATTAGGEIETTLSPMQLAYMHAAAEAEQREILSDEYPQWSFSRDELVRAVKQRQLERPAVSTRRKRQRTRQEEIPTDRSSPNAGRQQLAATDAPDDSFPSGRLWFLVGGDSSPSERRSIPVPINSFL